MSLANLDFYRENEEDFSEILYEFRKKSYEESSDSFIFRMWNDYVVDIGFVHEITPGKYGYSNESPGEYYDSKELIGWSVEKVSLTWSSDSWTHEEFLETLDEKGKSCFNSELKQFINQHA